MMVTMLTPQVDLCHITGARTDIARAKRVGAFDEYQKPHIEHRASKRYIECLDNFIRDNQLQQLQQHSAAVIDKNYQAPAQR